MKTTILRQRMTEDMQVRNLSRQTQASYVLQVSQFARYFNKSPAVLGRSREPDRVPILAGRSRPERAGEVYAADGGGAGQGKRGDRRGQRPAGPGAGRAAGDRPRHRGAAGHCHGRRGQHALRCLRPAPGLDHLYAAEPVPRGDGGGTELPDRSRDAEQSLREVGQRHAGSAEHAGALGAVAARNWRSATRASSRPRWSASTWRRARRWAMP